MRTGLIFTWLLVFAGELAADAKYLVPIVLTSPAEGAFNSRWTSVLSVHNPTDRSIYADLYRQCAIPTCLVEIPAGATVEGVPGLSPLPGRIGPGDFLLLGPDSADKVRLSLRVQDLSRQELTYGTEIPVVPETEAFTRALQLLGVPTNDRFRQMLRVYDFDSRGGARVEVSLHTASGTLLASRELTLAVNSSSQPAYAEIGWLASEFPMINGYERVRVQVRPLTPNLRFWAFISVTHNETQHLTVISPATD